eukprot:1458689-Alexandrium_andersonii.AAC.1
MLRDQGWTSCARAACANITPEPNDKHQTQAHQERVNRRPRRLEPKWLMLQNCFTQLLIRTHMPFESRLGGADTQQAETLTNTVFVVTKPMHECLLIVHALQIAITMHSLEMGGRTMEQHAALHL